MQSTPDLTLYQLVHRGMRRDTARLHRALASLTRPDEARAARIVTWYDGFLSEFHKHHTVEDDIFFPALAAHVAGFDELVARVDREHALLDDALTSLGQALGVLADPAGSWDAARGNAIDTIAEASATLTAHLDFEDEEILPLFVRHMSKEEYDTLEAAAMKGGSFRELRFVVPWTVSQATPAEKDVLLRSAPLPMRLLWRATRRGYDRLTLDVFAGPSTDSSPAGREAVATGRSVA